MTGSSRSLLARASRTTAGVLLFLAPAIALADAAPVPPSEEQVQAARVAYREARELHRQGRLKEALERALEAYKIANTPVTALEAGHQLVEAGRLVEAREIMRNVALFPVSPRESEKGRDARQAAATLGATLDARIPKVAIAGRPAGVDVVLDGKPFTANDPTAWLGLDPGAHALVVRAGDRICTTINITLAEAEARTIDLHDAATTCRIESTAPATEVPTPPAQTAQPAPRDAAPLPPSSPPGPSHRAESGGSGWRWAGVVIAGAGAVGLGVGGGIALAAKSSYDSVAADCPARGCSLSAYNTRLNARSQADAATVAMVVGAAAVLGGGLIFFLVPGRGSSDVGRPVVGIGPGRIELSVRFH
jgi:hypothetical protein